MQYLWLFSICIVYIVDGEVNEHVTGVDYPEVYVVLIGYLLVYSTHMWCIQVN